MINKKSGRYPWNAEVKEVKSACPSFDIDDDCDCKTCDVKEICGGKKES